MGLRKSLLLSGRFYCATCPGSVSVEAYGSAANCKSRYDDEEQKNRKRIHVILAFGKLHFIDVRKARGAKESDEREQASPNDDAGVLAHGTTQNQVDSAFRRSELIPIDPILA